MSVQLQLQLQLTLCPSLSIYTVVGKSMEVKPIHGDEFYLLFLYRGHLTKRTFMYAKERYCQFLGADA
jgi:hypothetical protein